MKITNWRNSIFVEAYKIQMEEYMSAKMMNYNQSDEEEDEDENLIDYYDAKVMLDSALRIGISRTKLLEKEWAKLSQTMLNLGML
jgi:DNA-binding transcriptional regulator/RsmH inhibitor MraZ